MLKLKTVHRFILNFKDTKAMDLENLEIVKEVKMFINK